MPSVEDSLRPQQRADGATTTAGDAMSNRRQE
jgi:hypothetical protein